MGPFTGGIDRTLRGLRTGDQRSLYLGIAMLVWATWRKSRRRKLVYSRELRRGEALVIRQGRRSDERLVIGDEFAGQIR